MTAAATLDRRRPVGAIPSSRSVPYVGGRVRLDLTSTRPDLRVRAVQRACFAPAGAALQLEVPRDVDLVVVRTLATDGNHLGSIEVVADDGRSVAAWVRALREATE